MTKYHKAADGSWTRCKASVRKGQNVSQCPIEAEGVEIEHTVGLEGIAAVSAKTGKGQVVRRWIAEDTYRETKVMALDENTFMASTRNKESVFTMKGKRISHAERVRAAKLAAKAPILPKLTDVEMWEVEGRLRELEEEVTVGLRDWNTSEGTDFRTRAMTAATSAESKVFTAESLALMLVVANRHNVPEELQAGVRAVRENVAEEPDPRAYVIQKAREAKQDAEPVAA